MTRKWEVAIRIAAGATIAVAVTAAVLNLVPPAASEVARPVMPAAPGASRHQSLRPDSLAQRLALRSPFRLSRSLVPYRLAGQPQIPPPAPSPSPERPSLVLAGVILGEEPAALIDGLPGTEGSRLLRVGERVGSYQLRSVGHESAVISGPDTTWNLRVRSQFP